MPCAVLIEVARVRSERPDENETAQKRSLPHTDSLFTADFRLEEIPSNYQEWSRRHRIDKRIATQQGPEWLKQVLSPLESEVIVENLLFSIRE